MAQDYTPFLKKKLVWKDKDLIQISSFKGIGKGEAGGVTTAEYTTYGEFKAEVLADNVSGLIKRVVIPVSRPEILDMHNTQKLVVAGVPGKGLAPVHVNVAFTHLGATYTNGAAKDPMILTTDGGSTGSFPIEEIVLTTGSITSQVARVNTRADTVSGAPLMIWTGDTHAIGNGTFILTVDYIEIDL